MSMQQFDESVDGWDGTVYSNGHPAFFTVYENSAVLFPTPDTAMTNGLKVLYNETPTDVVGLLDALALPLIYHNTIVKYCMWQANLLDESNEPALMYYNDFQSDMAVLQDNETKDPTATYQTITVLDYDR